MNQTQNVFEQNLKRFRRWLCENAVARVVNGFLPTFLDDQTKKIKVVVNDSMQPCTDGETIFVSLIPHFVEKDYSEEEWLIVLKAATAHEAQHVNSSNFFDMKEIQKWYGDYLSSNYGLDPSIGNTIAKNALNTVEDGRIERIAVLRRPGMYYPFQFLNEAIREGTAISGASNTPAGEYEDFWGTILSYAKTGLHSPGIEAYAKTELETAVMSVQSLIDDGIASNSSSECRNLVQALLETVSPYIVDLIKADPTLEDALTKKSATDEYTSNQGKPENGASTSGDNPLRVPAADPQNSTGKADETSQQDADGSGQPSESEHEDEQNTKPGPPQTGFCNNDKHQSPLSKSEMDELKKQVERELSSANQEEKASKEQNVLDALSNSDIESIRASYGGSTLPIKYTAISIAGNGELPDNLKSQALILRREIIRIQEARNKASKGLRRGALDTGALWKTGLREDTVFFRKGNPTAGSVVFYLALDNSGSMVESCSDHNSTLKKYQAARFAAAVIEEASKGIIPCKIVLFNQTSQNACHCVIKGFDETKGSNRSWNSLSAIGPGGRNMDSVNIRISALELSRRPERKKVLLTLSDGTPSAYESRAEAYAEVRQSVLEARRKGIIVIPIMFGDEDFLHSSQKAYELMYEKNIVACEPKEIINQLSALFRQIICR